MEFNHQVEGAISTPRLGTYRSQASSDDHAWALYRWNIDLAAAIAPLAAHHEPILNGIQSPGSHTVIALDDVWKQSVELLGWMSPDLADLHRNHSAMPELIGHRPQP